MRKSVVIEKMAFDQVIAMAWLALVPRFIDGDTLKDASNDC
jgi:hypothetical protein